MLGLSFKTSQCSLLSLPWVLILITICSCQVSVFWQVIGLDQTMDHTLMEIGLIDGDGE